MGVVDEGSGEVDEDANPTADSLVAFKWHFNVDGDMAVYEYRGRTRNVHGQGIPTPKMMLNAVLYKRMKKLAGDQLCPCAYLGVSLNMNGAESEGPFEPDPAKWPAGNQKDERVWFEWLHVQRRTADGRKPHRVSMLVGTANAHTLPTIDTHDASDAGNERLSAWGALSHGLSRKQLRARDAKDGWGTNSRQRTGVPGRGAAPTLGPAHWSPAPGPGLSARR